MASAIAALLPAALWAAPAHAAAGQPFPQIQSPFTEAVIGHAPSFFGGIAFAPNGDIWVDACQFSGSPLTRFSLGSTVLEHGTVVHPHTVVASNAGCGLTNHPDGHLYSNTSSGLARLDPSTGAAIDTVGTAGNALGVTVDPRTLSVVYVAADCRFGSTCTIDSFSPSTGAVTTFAQLSSADAAFVDGITFDSTGTFLFMSNRAPGFHLTVLDRSGHIVQSVRMTSEPDGISFHGVAPQFVVTNDTDGTMTRFDFPSNDYTQPPTQSVLASGGYRGDLSLVGKDGCIYLSQDGTNFLDGTTSGDNSVVQICPGFTPSPGVKPQLVYAAVGDSYSSGEGAPPFEDGTNYPPAIEQENTYTFGGGNFCHRSLTDYPKLSAPILDPNQVPLLIDRTCSGAQVQPPAGSVIIPAVGVQDTQVDQVRERLFQLYGGRLASDVNVVSATMGGNDAGFVDLITACLIPNLAQELFRDYPSAPGEIQWLVSNFGTCRNFDNLFFHTADKISKLQGTEAGAQASLLSTFSNAQVFQLTYPDVVPAPADFPGDSCGGLLRRDADYVRGKAQAIDDVIRTAGANRARLHIVDVQNGFGVNPLCPADPGQALVNGLDQSALAAVVSGLVAPGTQSRALLDALNSAYVDLRNCVLSTGIFSLLLCRGQLDALKAAVADLQNYFSQARINALVGQLAQGSTPEQQFDNSRLLFHPNAVGVGVMSCNLTAAFQNQGAGSCTPSLGGVLTYLFNGVQLSTTNPVLLTPGAPTPFQFNGFDPGTAVSVAVSSAPVQLGTFTADSTGTISGSITLPTILNPGVHRVEFRGTSNRSRRTIEVLVRIAGQPHGGDDYGLYFPGFAGEDQVHVTYGGLDWETLVPDGSGGVFVEVPLPVANAPGSLTVTLTGTTTGKSASQTITPMPPAPTLDSVVSGHQDTPASSFSAPPLSTAGGNELVLALVSSDGPASPTQAVTSVSGGGLAWQLVGRSNGALGTAEVWEAYTTAPLSSAVVTATLQNGGYEGSITVAAFAGAAPTIAASAIGDGPNGGPGVTLTTTRANSLVWAVGHDWSHDVPRTVNGDQTLVDQFLEPTFHDTSWTQDTTAPVTAAGTAVQVGDSAPTADRWEMSAVEIAPAGAATGGLGTDIIRTTVQTTPASSFSSPPVTTSSNNEMLLALVSTDGPTQPTQAVTAVTGGGLTWTRASAANGAWGAAEVWQAYAASPLNGVTVAATLANPGFDGSITVVGLTGARAALGAAGAQAGTSGPPALTLTTTAPGSEVWAVGHDWSHSAEVDAGTGQTLAGEFRDLAVNDTSWAQQSGPVAAAGSAVSVADTQPTADRWDLAAVEVVPAS